jgi:hypothetical protein
MDTLLVETVDEKVLNVALLLQSKDKDKDLESLRQATDKDLESLRQLKDKDLESLRRAKDKDLEHLQEIHDLTIINLKKEILESRQQVTSRGILEYFLKAAFVEMKLNGNFNAMTICNALEIKVMYE